VWEIGFLSALDPYVLLSLEAVALSWWSGSSGIEV